MGLRCTSILPVLCCPPAPPPLPHPHTFSSPPPVKECWQWQVHLSSSLLRPPTATRSCIAPSHSRSHLCRRLQCASRSDMLGMRPVASVEVL